MATPLANRIHIGIFGQVNSGKSSLLNFLTDQDFSIVSSKEGTTTDLVNKPMEIHGLGPVVFIDTPGFGDKTDLSSQRMGRMERALKKSDLALLLFSGNFQEEIDFYDLLKEKNIPTIPILSKADTPYPKAYLEKISSLNLLPFSGKNPQEKEAIFKRIIKASPKEEGDITGSLVKEGDLVVLVIPQDGQAPQGRLILPQVQTIREVIDKKAVAISTGLENLEDLLEKIRPDLIITDSQYFKEVYQVNGGRFPLTSFSVLFSGLKGDIGYFIESTAILKDLPEGAKILISEACTHPPAEEDIGRVKIPRLLGKLGKDLKIDFARGEELPDEDYDLVITCGACMFNRRLALNRVEACKERGIPMTNYGIFLAYMNGILEKIVY